MQPTRTRSRLALTCLTALLATAALTACSPPAQTSEQIAAVTAADMARPGNAVQMAPITTPVDSFVAVTMKIAEALGAMPAPLGAQSVQTMTAALVHRDRVDSAFMLAGVARPSDSFRLQRLALHTPTPNTARA